MRSVILTILFLAGCPVKPTPMPDLKDIAVTVVMADAAMPQKVVAVCTSQPAPTPQDVCDGLFTVNGLSCVNCGLAWQGCLDKQDNVYCIVGNCLDTACQVISGQ